MQTDSHIRSAGEKSDSRRRPFLKWLVRRLVVIPVSIFVIITISFAIVNLAPGDPAIEIAGPSAGPADVQQVRVELGLDLPIAQRYVSYLSHLVKGDLGKSYYTKRPVITELWEHLPNTIELVALSLALAIGIGLLVGGLGAFFRTKWVDRVSRTVIAATQSLPDFFLGLVLIYFFFFVLRIVPSPVGRLGILDTPPPSVTGFMFIDSIITGRWATFGELVGHAVLPVVTLGVVYSAYFAKTTLSVVRRELSSKYAEFARASGLSEFKVFKYALLVGRNHLLTYLAILFGSLIGGVAIIETVFSWNGAGSWALTAMLRLDIPAVQAFILFAGLITLFTYLLLDALVAALDPRITLG